MAKADKKDKKPAEKSKKAEPKKEVKKDAKKPEKGKGKKPAAKNTEFTQKKFSGSIALSKLVHVTMTKTNKKGKKIKGLFIPIEENCLVEGKEGAVYLAISVVTKSPQDDFGQNGFIAQNGNKKWSECSEKEKEKFKGLPILGNIKDFEDHQGSANDTSGNKGEVDEDDDLPF